MALLPAILGPRATPAQGRSRLVYESPVLERTTGYRPVLEDLRADLPAVASALSELTPQVVTARDASGAGTHLRDGQRQGVIVQFVRDVDGVWRIAAM